MEWKTMLAYITGAVDEGLLLRVDSPPPEIPVFTDCVARGGGPPTLDCGSTLNHLLLCG